jgi:hypothetical protein
MNRFVSTIAALVLLALCATAGLSSSAAAADEAKGTWVPLFNGKDLTGWKALPGGQWEAKDGVIKGTSPQSEKQHGMLLSEKEYDDFTVRVVYRSLKGNSGFYFRVEQVKSAVAVHGFQAEIDSGGNSIGGLYETGGRAWVTKPTQEEVAKFYKPKDWNEMVVTTKGRDVTVTVNGVKTAELKDDKGRTKGFFGLQLHGGQEMDVEFKSIELLKQD